MNRSGLIALSALLIVGLLSPSARASSLWPPQTKVVEVGLDAAPDPVSASDGAFYFNMSLLELGGPMNLGFRMRYHSDQPRSNWDLSDFPSWGKWWWDPKATCIRMGMGDHEVLQFQIERANPVAFVQYPGEDWRLVDETDYGMPGSPVAFQVAETNDWLYLLDPRDGKTTLFDLTNDMYRIRAVVDRNGNTLQYQYDPDNLHELQPARIADDYGRFIDLTYTNIPPFDSFIGALTDHAGRRVLFRYEKSSDEPFANEVLREVVDVTGGTNRFDYTDIVVTQTWGNVIYADLMTAHRLPAGNTPWTQDYDVLRIYDSDEDDKPAVIRQTDAYGNDLVFQYDTNAHTVAVAWPDGGTNFFRHGGRGQPPVQVDAPGGLQTRFSQDDRNRFTALTDPTGAEVAFAYDPTSGQLASVTNSAGEVLRFEYTPVSLTVTNPFVPADPVTFALHEIAAIRYPDGTSETFAYDARGNVTSRTDRAGQATLFTYDARGNFIRRTDPNGLHTDFTYDASSRLTRIEDADGVSAQFVHDALDRIVRRTDGAGRHTDYAYDAAGRLTRATDPLGNETVFAYDANGNRIRATAPDGAVTGVEYDLMDRVAAATNALGGVSTRAYDAMGRLAETVGADGITNRYFYNHAGQVTNATRAGVGVSAAYDAEGRLLARTSARGHTATLARDPDGRLAGSTNALGHAVQWERDAAGRIVKHTDANGQHTDFEYDAAGRLAKTTDAEGRAWNYAYDAVGRLAATTDPDAAQTRYAYTPAGRLAAVTNALDDSVHYAYDAAGRLARYTDEHGQHTDYAYDDAGRLAGVTDAAANAWAYAYDPAGRLSGVTNPLGGAAAMTYLPGGFPATRTDSETGVWSNTWDQAGRLVAATDPLGRATAYAYDEVGRLARITDARGQHTDYEYDADGNLTRLTDQHGHHTDYTYDAIGQVTSVVHSSLILHPSSFAYDPVGRLIRAEDPDGVAVETDYDATGLPLVRRLGPEAWTNAYDTAGRLASVASPLGRTTTLQRDALGRVVKRTDAHGQDTDHEYDAAGRLTKTTDPEGRAWRYAYDALGRLTRVTLNDGGHADYERDALGNIVRITDLGGHDWQREWTPMGRLLRDVDPLARANAYQRDALGRLDRVTRPDASTLDLHYDPLGLVTARVYSAGLTLAYEYDAAGRLVKHTNGHGQSTDQAYDEVGRLTNALINGTAYATTWTPGGRLASVTYADGALTVSYTYDPVNGRLTSVSDNLSGARVDFLYDADGRLVRQTDEHGRHTDYTHDAAGRVTRIQSTLGIDLQYTYDNAGRLVSETRAVPKPARALLQAAAEINQFDAASQLANPAAAYDLLGRRTADDRHTYTWSADGRLAAVDGVTYAYDALGRVTARDGQPLACHPAIGGAPLVDDGTNWYVWTPGGRLLYMVAQAPGHAVHHYRFDRSGHAIALVDAAGAVAEAYAYEPGGLELDPVASALGNPFRFLGRYGLRAEGAGGDLYHVRARWYDARTRAFLSKEPVWPQTDDPHFLNPYQYARNNPVNLMDVDGLGLPDNDLWKYTENDGTWQDVPVDPKSYHEALRRLDQADARYRMALAHPLKFTTDDLPFEIFVVLQWLARHHPDTFSRLHRNRLAQLLRIEIPHVPWEALPMGRAEYIQSPIADVDPGIERAVLRRQIEQFDKVLDEVKVQQGGGGRLEAADNDLYMYGKNDGTWREIDHAALDRKKAAAAARGSARGVALPRSLFPPATPLVTPVAQPGQRGGGLEAPDNDLWEIGNGDDTWQEVNHKRGGGLPDNDLWKYTESDGTWQDVPVAPRPEPKKEALAATSKHVGRGEKRKATLVRVGFQWLTIEDSQTVAPNKRDIKLSHDWEGTDGNLDIKGPKLGNELNR